MVGDGTWQNRTAGGAIASGIFLLYSSSTHYCTVDFPLFPSFSLSPFRIYNVVKQQTKQENFGAWLTLITTEVNLL